MEELGFKRKDRNNVEVWKNSINERIIFNEATKGVEFRDEIGDSFPISRELLLAVADYMANKGW